MDGAEAKTDYELLLTELAQAGGQPEPSNVYPKGIRVRNLWLGFNKEGQVARLRIFAPRGEWRDLVVECEVRRPRENLEV